MQTVCHCETPLGQMLLAADEVGLTGAWFFGQRYFARGLAPDHREGDSRTLILARDWLARYFAGQRPEDSLPLHLTGTAFQNRVWSALAQIPYGETTSYAALARVVGSAPRAVGGAVGRNPISVILPCHRVLAANGDLTGYAGGLDRKRALLALEQGAPLWTGRSMEE